MIDILVVEDDMKFNQIVCAYLNKNGYIATGCLDVNAAYLKMEETKFGMIISDVMMPGVDGFEFAENIREMDKSTPILFMTSRDDMPSKEKGFEMGILLPPEDNDQKLPSKVRINSREKCPSKNL